jgi:hypothetical protein
MTGTTALAPRPDVLSGLIPAARHELDGKPTRVGSPVGLGIHIVPGTGGHGRARADAFLAVIKVFGCQTAVYGYSASRGDTFLAMTGTAPALEALEIFLPDLAVRMEASGREAVREYVGSGPGAARRTYFRDYLRGYGHGAAEAIRAARSGMLETHASDLGEFLAVATVSVEREFIGRFGAQKPLRSERGGNVQAWRAGAAAGYAVQDQDEYLFIHDLVFAML